MRNGWGGGDDQQRACLGSGGLHLFLGVAFRLPPPLRSGIPSAYILKSEDFLGAGECFPKLPREMVRFLSFVVLQC